MNPTELQLQMLSDLEESVVLYRERLEGVLAALDEEQDVAIENRRSFLRPDRRMYTNPKDSMMPAGNLQSISREFCTCATCRAEKGTPR